MKDFIPLLGSDFSITNDINNEYLLNILVLK